MSLVGLVAQGGASLHRFFSRRLSVGARFVQPRAHGAVHGGPAALHRVGGLSEGCGATSEAGDPKLAADFARGTAQI